LSKEDKVREHAKNLLSVTYVLTKFEKSKAEDRNKLGATVQDKLFKNKHVQPKFS
jgi:hypothetical protein